MEANSVDSSILKEIPSENRRILIVIISISLGLLITFCLSLSIGSVSLSLEEIYQALWHRGAELNQVIVWDLRLPRILAAFVVGSALGTSGALLQGMLRNSLATPFFCWGFLLVLV